MSMKKVPAKGSTVKGLDVSHWQPTVDWSRVKASGHEFVFLKATEGLTFRDKSFEGHREGARKAGLLVGAYHFFRPNLDPKAQAVHFAKVVGPLAENDLPCVFDWEVSDGHPSADDVQEARIFLQTIKDLTRKNPILYSGPYFLNSFGLGEEFKQYPLWIAHYGTKAPLVPAPWTYWSFHQFTDKGIVPGVGSDKTGEDSNVFNGSLEQLKKFTAFLK